MLIIKRQYGPIIKDPQKIDVSYNLGAVVALDMHSTEPPIPITNRLPSGRAVHLTLEWLYNQIFHHRNDRNIVIDINACPFLNVKEEDDDEGASIEELRI